MDVLGDHHTYDRLHSPIPRGDLKLWIVGRYTTPAELLEQLPGRVRRCVDNAPASPMLSSGPGCELS